ncbi:hypothetical protein FA15DRAFT_308815 [Coprinopsis marcescibilis]|uniref:DUF6535 domain-containing protein n=1 Tax=Coprinopsis marcescibilis TaxID=230819 RepID=A0A5C3KCV2_COPMA|nr:hypothetical protein FA15DRAFT_308815 [Coprinopsis marcescibilis]
MMDKHDEEMCAAWKEEVDKLLIFAGLFSATITAFTVESYRWLRQEPEDATAQLLTYLTTHLTVDIGPLPQSLVFDDFQVSTAEVVINLMWFLSLTLSLTAVFIGILCLQWLREYQRDAALPHKDAVALRQMRFEGLLHWHVPDIIMALPVLLLLSLILFFVGLLYLLWSRNVVVAACVSCLVGLVMLFIGVTTFLPAIQHAFSKDVHLRVPQCPYKSPQSWLIYKIGHGIFSFLANIIKLPSSTLDSERFHRMVKSVRDASWLAYDMRWRQLRDATSVIRGAPKQAKDQDDLLHAVHWLNANFAQSVDAVYPLHSCLISELDIPSAERLISNVYLELGQIEAATFKVMLDDRFSPRDVQKRDIISAYYLHLHQDAHPVLKAAYIEAVVRILNSQEVPEPFYDWLTEILAELTGKVVSTLPQPSHRRISGDADMPLGSGAQASAAKVALDEEIVVQVLMCVKDSILARNLSRIVDVGMMWNLIHHLLYESVTGAKDGSGVAAVPPKFSILQNRALILEIVEDLNGWLRRGKERDRPDRVKICAEGVMKVFPFESWSMHLEEVVLRYQNPDGLEDEVQYSPVGVAGLNPPSPSVVLGQLSVVAQNHNASNAPKVDWWILVRFIHALDEHMERMGGAGVVFARGGRSFELWGRRFQVWEWKGLVEALGTLG